MAKKPEDIKSIFFAALKRKNTAERVAYLDGACGKDAILRTEIESLLKSHDKAGDFLSSPDLNPEVTPSSSHLNKYPGTVVGNNKHRNRYRQARGAPQNINDF